MSRKDLSDWKGIAQELNMKNPTKIHRSAKQCRERWNNHVNPEVNRGPWTPDQDSKLLSLILEIGKKWSQIAKEFGNRTENAVKNRWHSLMRRVGVGDSNAEMNESEEREKIKQLFNILSSGAESDSKNGNSVELSDSLTTSKKGPKAKNHQAEIKSEHDDADHKHAHQKNFLKRATGRNSASRKNKSEADVKSLSEKIQSEPGKIPVIIQNPLGDANLGSIIEKQLLNNLAYVPKPSLPSIGSAIGVPSSTTHVKLFSEGQLEAKPLQLSKDTPAPLSTGINPELHSRLTELAMAMNSNNSEASQGLLQTGVPVIQTSSLGAIPFAGNTLIFAPFPQPAQQINSSQPSGELNNGLKFEVKTEDVSQKEQLKRLFSELETTLLKNGNPTSTQKPTVTSSQNNSTLMVRIEEPKANIADTVLQQSHKYQFSLINRETNTIILLDPVTSSNLMFIKEISKLSNSGS